MFWVLAKIVPARQFQLVPTTCISSEECGKIIPKLSQFLLLNCIYDCDVVNALNIGTACCFAVIAQKSDSFNCSVTGIEVWIGCRPWSVSSWKQWFRFTLLAQILDIFGVIITFFKDFVSDKFDDPDLYQ